MKELEKMLGINTGSLTALLIDVGIRIAITLAITSIITLASTHITKQQRVQNKQNAYSKPET